MSGPDDDDDDAAAPPEARLRLALGRADALCACADSILSGGAVGDREAHERAAHLVELTGIAIREANRAGRELIARIEGVGGGGGGGGGNGGGGGET